MCRKLTFKEVKDFVENNSDCKLLSKEYFKNTDKLLFKCKCGNLFETTFNNFKTKNKRQCKECSKKMFIKKMSLSYNEVKKFIEIESNSGCKLISNSYVNAKKDLIIKCKCGDIFKTSFDFFKNKDKRQCNKCGFENLSKQKRTDGNIVYNMFIKNGYIPLFKPEDYINEKEKLKYICPNHKDIIQYISYEKMKDRNGCLFCFYEKRAQILRLDGNIVYNTFIENDLTPMFKSNDYVNNTQSLPYICNKHSHLGIMFIRYGKLMCGEGCPECGKIKVSRENNYNWKGGISPIQNYFRDKINPWKITSLIKYNRKCIITNIKSPNLIVHHLYGFNMILKETLNELNLEILPKINLYSEKQLNDIEELLIKKHYEYGLGVPLTHEVHNLFHKVYGKGNNTPEQFGEFVDNYKNGKYEELLNNNSSFFYQ